MSVSAAPSLSPLRLGVVGLGRAFTLMLPTFQQDPRIELVAACDTRAAARAQFVSDFHAPVFDSIEGLAAGPRVEAIYIASPHQHHAEHVRIAAAHGKHVLLEKPMATTLAECDAMIGHCHAAGVQLIIGHCHSFDAPILRAAELIASGELGRVRMIQALNYTDWMLRPRRPEELDTAQGGGVTFSQAAHQVDVVRLLAGSRVVRVRSVLGRWDAARPTEGAYSALLWFADGAFATLSYSGYGHFDSDEWCDGHGELGRPKGPAQHGQARRRLAAISSAQAEAQLKGEATYGGPAYRAFDASKASTATRAAEAATGVEAVGSSASAAPLSHQHFGPLIVSCERGAVRPMADALWVYGDFERERRPLPPPAVPRAEVIDELFQAIRQGQPPLHDGPWARATIEVCLALLRSAQIQGDVLLPLGAGE